MKNQPFFSLLLIVLVSVIAGFTPFLVSPADTSWIPGISSHFVVHLVSNSLIEQSLFPVSPYWEIRILIFLTGIATAGALQKMQISKSRVALYTVTLLLIEIMFCGKDILIWRFLALTSLLFVISLATAHRKLLFFSCSIVLLTLEPLLACIALIATLLVLETCARFLKKKELKITQGMVVTLALITWSSSLFTSPPVFPAYLEDARVIPDDGIPGIVRPTVGAAPEIPTLNRDKMRNAYLPPSRVLLLFSVLTLFLVRKLVWPVIVVALSLLIDLFLRESIALIGPVASLERILPGHAVVSITVLALGFLPYLLCMLLAVSRQHRDGRSRFVFTEVSFCFAGLGLLAWYPLHTVPLPSVELSSEAPFIPSLSLPVYQEYGAPLVAAYRNNPNPSPQLIGFSVYDLATNEKRPEVQDEDRSTRWSTPASSKDGGIKIGLNKPSIVEGILLKLGTFSTDFPGSLHIEGTNDCSSPEWDLITSIPRWLGAIRFTRGGYPYFGGEDNVVVPFPKPVKVECLRIRQLVSRPPYDWSIAEVRLF